MAGLELHIISSDSLKKEINNNCKNPEWLKTENFWNEKALSEAEKLLEKIVD